MNINKILKEVKLNSTEEQILHYLEANSKNILNIRIQKVANDNFTSTSSVFRLAKKLGFSGYKELSYFLTNSHKDNDLSNMDELSALSLAKDIHFMFNKNKNAFNLLKSSFEANNSIIIIANGYSSILGEYLYKKLLMKGIRTMQISATDSNKILENNLNNLTHVIIISRSGETVSLLNLLKIVLDAKTHHNIQIVSFTQNSNNSIAKQADIDFKIIDANKADWDNLSSSQFHPFLLMYFEHLLDNLF